MKPKPLPDAKCRWRVEKSPKMFMEMAHIQRMATISSIPSHYTDWLLSDCPLWWLLMCFCRSCGYLNSFEHVWHWYSLMPVCHDIWPRSVVVEAKPLPHIVHWYRYWPWSSCMCVVIKRLEHRTIPQTAHVSNRSEIWKNKRHHR